MTLREFSKLEILSKEDNIYLVKCEGSFVSVLEFDNEITVGNVENHLKPEILDKEISYITPYGTGLFNRAYVVHFKEDN